MKLRVKLSLLAGAVLLLATLLCNGLSFSISRRTILQEAARGAYAQSEAAFQGFESYCGRFQGELSPSAGVYWLKSQNQEYSILLRNGEAVYNPTVLEPSELRTTPKGGSEPQEAGLYHGRRLLAYSFEAVSPYTFIHIVDVTDTYLSLYRLAAQEAALSAAVLAGGALTVFLILRRALRPLQALSDGANSIAAGAYGQRVPESGRDELAGLGRDFNRMAGAVEEHIRRVEESEEQKTMFMASLTHELKTPLTAISGYGQTLRYAKLSDEDRDTALMYICRESGRLDRLSKKMLRLLELDRDVPITLEPVPIASLAAGARETCIPGAAKRGVSIVLGPLEGDIPCDRDLMTEVIVNLVDNGIKACKKGGKVVISSEGGRVTVEDSGCGIPQEEIARLTEAFYMVDKSRSRQSGGAGLGLALAAVILRRHGMRLHIESRVGEGTRAVLEKC